MGNSIYAECAIESETVTINDFFNGIEPNNQVPCDCEGDVCLDDHDDDEEREVEAEDRFSLKNLMKGKKEDLGPLVHRIHDGITQMSHLIRYFYANQCNFS